MRFQRFTAPARWLVRDAVAEAERRGDPLVGTEHLLLALAASPLCGLAEFGVTRERVRDALDRLDVEALDTIGISVDPQQTVPSRPGFRAPRRRHLPFTKEAKDVLESAVDEASALGERHLGPLHVALAMTQVPFSSPARRLLQRLDAEPLDVRRRLLEGRDRAA